MNGPPPELKSWSKRQLIREVERLRAITREHAERMSDEPAPERAGGFVDTAGDPHARGGVVIDARGAVLMDSVDVCLVDTKRDEPASLMLTLAGRVNYDTRRSSVTYLMPTDGAAAIITQLFGLAQRAGGDFEREFTNRMRELP